MERKDLKSFHIFMFPFSWKIFNKDEFHFNQENNLRSFLEKLSSKWIYEVCKGHNEEEYNEMMYFLDHGKDAIFSRYNKNEKEYKEQMLYSYLYNENNGKYVIEIKEDNSIKEYVLHIEKINLKIYKTGIGMISFYLLNDKYDNKEDILKINDYGRRIYPPFLPVDVAKEVFLAQELRLDFHKYFIKESFEDILNNRYKISKMIIELLGENFKFIHPQIRNKDVEIKPIMDRMYVICWYGNDDLLEEIKQSSDKFENNSYWFNLIAVNSASNEYECNRYIKTFIKKHTYDRWIKKGSLYGVTSTSLVLISKTTWQKENLVGHLKLINDLRTIYYDMVCLALAQRASILNFSNEVATISMSKKDNLVKKISRLYRDYLQFINRMYFREITCKEQGSVIYSKIEEAMKVELDMINLKKEIDELHEYARLMSEQRTNKALHLLTIIGGAFVIPTFFTGYFGMNIFEENLLKWYSHKELLKWMFIYFLLPAMGTLFFIYSTFKNKK